MASKRAALSAEDPRVSHGWPWISAQGRSSEKVALRITAEHADIWHGFSYGKAGVVRHKNAVLDDWCAKMVQPRRIERS